MWPAAPRLPALPQNVTSLCSALSGYFLRRRDLLSHFPSAHRATRAWPFEFVNQSGWWVPARPPPVISCSAVCATDRPSRQKVAGEPAAFFVHAAAQEQTSLPASTAPVPGADPPLRPAAQCFPTVPGPLSGAVTAFRRTACGGEPVSRRDDSAAPSATALGRDLSIHDVTQRPPGAAIQGFGIHLDDMAVPCARESFSDGPALPVSRMTVGQSYMAGREYDSFAPLTFTYPRSTRASKTALISGTGTSLPHFA